MIEPLPQSAGALLGFKLSGKFHDEDYKQFVPVIDAAIAEHGKVRLLAQFDNFHGWDFHAVWDDTKFAVTHCTSVERVALVGDKDWEAAMAKVCGPFTMAKLRYFDVHEADAAWSWLGQTE